MSKGGAGKVYFVLYLAVILELLIIIVERDEAEEHLMAKQKESMKIVQSILSQLQVGGGVEGISTRPQDQIVLKDPSWANQPGMDLIKEERDYLVEVGVTDVIGDISRITNDEKLGPNEKLERLHDFALTSNVRELQYQIWYTSTKDTVPQFPTDSTIGALVAGMKGTFREVSPAGYNWTLVGMQVASYDSSATLSQNPINIATAADWWEDAVPVYKYQTPQGKFAQFGPGGDEKQFEYNHIETTRKDYKSNHLSSLKVRKFSVKFKPVAGTEGMYKLHFYSRTNKILGISSDVSIIDVSDDDVVNIGTVQLSVKDLRSVKRELEKTIETEGLNEISQQFNDGKLPAVEYREKIKQLVNGLVLHEPEEAGRVRLYGAINLILRPGASDELDPNRSSMGFTVKVVKPNIPTADPFVEYDNTQMYAYAGVGPAFYVTTGPSTPGTPAPEGFVESGGQRISLQFESKGSGGAAASADASKGGAGSSKWLASSTSPLSQGEWTATITQRTGGKTETKEAAINVYGTSLEDSDAKRYVEDLKTRLREVNYGSRLKFNVLQGAPDDASVKHVPASQFMIAIKSNKQDQPEVFRGLSAEVEVDESATEYALDFIWQNSKGEKVTLLSASSIPAMQKGPEIGRQLSNPSGYQAGSSIEVVGTLSLTKPSNLITDASSKFTKPTVTVESNTLRGITAPSVSASIEEEGNGLYRVRLDISGDIDRKTPVVTGSVSLKVSASITNPNNRQKGTSRSSITVPVNVAVEAKSRSRGGQRR